MVLKAATNPDDYPRVICPNEPLLLAIHWSAKVISVRVADNPSKDAKRNARAFFGVYSPATIRGRILGLMDPDLSALADVYLRYYLTKRDEYFWAFEEVQHRVRSDLSQAWAVTQALLAGRQDRSRGSTI